jgi:uncharacterized protein (TIGR03437 family)
MSIRGMVLALAGLWGCATALNAQVLPPCLFGQDTAGCTVGSSFSFDLGQFFELGELASIINGIDGAEFTYNFAATGSLPPGLSLTPSGLLSGTFSQGGNFSFSIDITETLAFQGQVIFSESFPIPFTIDVTGYSGPPLTVDPSSISLSLIQNGAPVTQSVSLTNHGNQAVQVSASATTISGGNWLTATAPGSIATLGSGAVAITGDPSKLQPGTYTGSVTISVSGGATSRVSVLAVVTGTQPNLLLSQTGLFFQAVSGGTASPPQPITVLNSGAGLLNFTAAASTISGGNWLSVSSSSGSASATSPGSAKVSVSPGSLQPGAYYGKVTFAASGAADSPQVASVVLNVVSPANSPGALVQPAGMYFVGSVGGTNPAAKTVSITNPSPNALTYLVTPFSNGNVSWLTATPASGSVSAAQPGTLSVQPNLKGLNAGAYIGDLTIAFVPAGNTPTATSQVLHVEVLLIVLPAGVTPSDRPALEPRATGCTPTQLIPFFTLLGSGFSATVGWPSELEVTVVDDCGTPLLAGSVNVTFSSADPALSLTSIGAGSWTSTWNASNAASNVTITAQAQQVKPALSGKASIGGALQTNTAVPSVSTGGIVSAANFVPNQPLAPGSFGAIFGANLSPSLVGSNQYPLSTELGSTSVLLGSEQLPLLFASGGQINMVVPYDVPVNSTQQLVVQRGSAISIPQSVVISAALPAVFTQNGNGTGAAIVQPFQPDGTPLALNAPVSAGDVIVLYCSGLGAVNPPVPAGSQTPLAPLSYTANDVTVSIGGVPQKALFAGLTPTYAQLYQVNVTVPTGLPPGDATLTLSMAGQQSAPVTITIQ